MSDIDPLIKREMQWMAVSVNDNRDLAPIIIAKVRRQRIIRSIVAVFAIFAISAGRRSANMKILKATSCELW